MAGKLFSKFFNDIRWLSEAVALFTFAIARWAIAGAATCFAIRKIEPCRAALIKPDRFDLMFIAEDEALKMRRRECCRHGPFPRHTRATNFKMRGMFISTVEVFLE